MLYLLGFAGAVLSLLAWLYLKAKHKSTSGLPAGFVLALGAYVIGLLISGAPIDFKLGVFARDMLIIGVSGLAMMAMLARRKGLVPGLIALVLVLIWAFQFWVKPSFQSHAETIELDKEGELLIQLTEGRQVEELREVAARFGLEFSLAFDPADPDITKLDDYQLVNVPPRYERRLARVKKALRASGMIDWLEENEVIRVAPMESAQPAPARRQYGVDDPGLSQLWGFDAMQVDRLYELLREGKVNPKKRALIAILDTGIDAGHEDIKANYRSLRATYDNDPMKHGTHCAGIAASVSNNGLGVASFSLDNSFFQVTSIKVLNAGGSGTQQSIIRGMIEAADAGADVISMSLGGRTGSVKQTAYEKAVRYAAQKGAIVVAAAGNSNRNAREFAPVNATGVIGVSAVDVELNRAVFSNFVNDIEWAVAAPGVNIYSTIPGNQYASFNGTSMATPYVAGLVGLLKSVRPELTAKEVYTLLKDTGKDTKNTRETGRLIQPEQALRQVLR
jgi:thermitase